MAVYDIKDSVKRRLHMYGRKNEKMQVVTPVLWHSCVLFLVRMEKKICLKSLTFWFKDSFIDW